MKRRNPINVIVVRFFLIIIFSGVLNNSHSQNGEFLADSNTVALWHFNSATGSILIDSSGNGHDGVITGSNWVNGLIGKGLHFDGINDSIGVPNDGSFGFTVTENFTIEAWFIIDTLAEHWIFSHKNGSRNGYSFAISGASNLANFAVEGNTQGVNYSVISTSSITTECWHYIAVMYNGQTRELSLYLDGQFEQSTICGGNLIGTIGHLGTSFTIGTRGKGTSPWFKGILDEVRISDTVRSASEIQAHWQLNKGLATLSSNWDYTQVDKYFVFSDSSTNNPTLWIWDFGDGNFSIAQNPIYTYSDTGTYKVCLITTNSCGSDTLCKNVFIGATFVQNLTEEHSFLIFPNPNTGTFTLDIGNSKNQYITIQVYDILGRTVFEKALDGKKINELITIANIRSGVYFARIKVGDSIVNIKILIQ